MATIQGGAVPKKRIATYGKAVRRRIPEPTLTSWTRKSQTPEVQSEADIHPSPSMPSIDTMKMKTIERGIISRTISPASPVVRDIFDVPPSDDEDSTLLLRKTIHKTTQKSTAIRRPKSSSNKETSDVRMETLESRKRLKLSPAPQAVLKPLPEVASMVKPSSKVGAPFAKYKPQGSSHKTTIVARPKLKAGSVGPKSPNTPRKITPPVNPILVPSTPSSQFSDVDMMDVDPGFKHISPKGLQMWKGLLNSAEAQEELSVKKRDEQVRRTGIQTGSSISHESTIFKTSGVTKRPQKVRQKLPRRRLIDSLTEQVTNQEDTDEDAQMGPQKSDGTPEVEPGLDVVAGSARGQSLLPEHANPVGLVSDSQNSQITGPKFTYSRQRSMLAEEDLMQQLALDMPSQPPVPQGRNARRGLIPSLQPLSSFHEQDDDGDGGGTAIRSVHELRQAGANSRFLDEIEDLLDRIGSPGTQVSMRRSGLLDMASKMKDKNFARQFRANHVEERLFLHLGQETDVITGYIMISLLMVVLVEGSIPHIVGQLRQQGIARLLIRLLEGQTSIVALSKDRKSNVSKFGQKLLLEHQEYLLQLPIWEDLKLENLSPRTVALKCLELMVRQTREAGNASDIFSKELTTNLFDIMKTASDKSSWDLQNGQHTIDFYLALSALESHSIAARTVHDETIWLQEYLPIIADTLETALSQPVDTFGVLQVLILRLTLNVTNNNPEASDVFARTALMSSMGQAIVAKFAKISRFLTEVDLSMTVDHLILLLGVMINFAEWSLAARHSLQSLEGESRDPLNGMIQTFIDNQERTSEAESVEETEKNVAFGYLSVLLGYFSLLPAISDRFQNLGSKKTLRPLLSSIEEFIGHHKTVDEIIAAEADGHNPQVGLTERLENLVNRLKGSK